MQQKINERKPNAVKQCHNVDLGWYHFDKTRKMFIQVREKVGGGQRTCYKDMNKRNVIDKCVELFFPEGQSQYGPLEDMSVDLTDFQLKSFT